MVVKPVIRVVLFDLDGTLLDSFEHFYGLMTKILARYAHAPLSKTKFRARFVLPIGQNAVTFGLTNISGQDFRKLYLESARSEAAEVQMFSDAPRTLGELVNQGYTVGLVTDESRNAVHKYLNSKLEAHFSVIVTGEDVNSSKPSPEPLLKALKILGCAAQEAVYVGDMVEDVVAAKRAKMFSCAIYRRGRNFHPLYRLKKARPDLLLTSLDPLTLRIRSLR